MCSVPSPLSSPRSLMSRQIAIVIQETQEEAARAGAPFVSRRRDDRGYFHALRLSLSPAPLSLRSLLNLCPRCSPFSPPPQAELAFASVMPPAPFPFPIPFPRAMSPCPCLPHSCPFISPPSIRLSNLAWPPTVLPPATLICRGGGGNYSSLIPFFLPRDSLNRTHTCKPA